MAYAFDGRAFGQVLVDTERLAERAREYEGRLASFVGRLEQHAGHVRTHLLVEIEQLAAAAREQRAQAEGMLARLVGTPLPLMAANAPSLTAPRARVLIVDDSEEQRDLATQMLEHAGFSVITAANGLEALMVAHYARPAVVLMDVNMPVLDGIEATRLLKASPATRHVQVIAFTAWPAFYDGPLKAVFDAVLPKPATMEALIATVARLSAPSVPAPSLVPSPVTSDVPDTPPEGRAVGSR